MKIVIKLSEGSIIRAIERLEQAQDNLRYGTGQMMEILAKEGAGIAQGAYRSMARVDYAADETKGTITTSGAANLIAEFGAGDTTADPRAMFANVPKTDVYPGSYSEQVGSGEYARDGVWHFGGREYYYIPPRAGLYAAKQYIEQNAGRIAKEVIKL